MAMGIKNISLKGLWHAYDIEWKINERVTILSGINGSGKSTILRIVGTLLKGEFLPDFMVNKVSEVVIKLDDDLKIESKIYHESLRSLKKKAEKDDDVAVLVERLEKEPENNLNQLNRRFEAQSVQFMKGKHKISKEEFQKRVLSDFISTFDHAPKKPEDSSKMLEYIIKAQYSELDRHLDNVISRYKSYLIELSNNVTNLVASDPENISSVREILRSRNTLQDIIDDFFSQTKKRVNREKGELEFIFNKDEMSHPCSDLSAGEKQLILILLTVFMQSGKPSILIMDEPEISLHVDWQRKLIEKILELNPKCQIIVSTHSPSMILNGWHEAVVNVSSLSGNFKKYVNIAD